MPLFSAEASRENFSREIFFWEGLPEKNLGPAKMRRRAQCFSTGQQQLLFVNKTHSRMNTNF